MTERTRSANDTPLAERYAALPVLAVAAIAMLAGCTSGGGAPEPNPARIDVSRYLPADYQRQGDLQTLELEGWETPLHLVYYKTSASKGQLLAGYYSGAGDAKGNPVGKPLDMVWQELSRDARLGDYRARAESRHLFRGTTPSIPAVLIRATDKDGKESALSVFRPSVSGNRLSLSLVHASFSGERGTEIADVDGNGAEDIVERSLFHGALISSTLICRKAVYLQSNGTYPQGANWNLVDFCDAQRTDSLTEPEETVVAYYRAKGSVVDDSASLLIEPGKTRFGADKTAQRIGSLTARPGDDPANRRLITVSLYDAKTRQPAGNVTWLVVYIPQEKAKPGVWRIEDRR